MPKEVTYSSGPGFLAAPNDANEYALDSEHPEGCKFYQRGVHVGWVRGSQRVEIGVARFDPSREMPTAGHFTELDRTGVNKLILSLRKARDAAFGRDA